MTRGFAAGTDPDLRAMMTRAGIRMPPGRAEGLEDRYVYLDTNGNPQEVQVCFQWNVPLGNGSAANAVGDGMGNVMVITGLTPDLARALDQMIDGKPDEREGRFRRQGVLNNAGGTNPNLGDPAAIFLFRYVRDADGQEVPKVYHLNMMQTGSYFLAQKFVMQDKDVLYFGNASANQPSKLVQLISQLFSPVLTVTSAVSVIQNSNN